MIVIRMGAALIVNLLGESPNGSRGAVSPPEFALGKLNR